MFQLVPPQVSSEILPRSCMSDKIPESQPPEIADFVTEGGHTGVTENRHPEGYSDSLMRCKLTHNPGELLDYNIEEVLLEENGVPVPYIKIEVIAQTKEPFCVYSTLVPMKVEHLRTMSKIALEVPKAYDILSTTYTTPAEVEAGIDDIKQTVDSLAEYFSQELTK